MKTKKILLSFFCLVVCLANLMGQYSYRTDLSIITPDTIGDGAYHGIGLMPQVVAFSHVEGDSLVFSVANRDDISNTIVTGYKPFTNGICAELLNSSGVVISERVCIASGDAHATLKMHKSNVSDSMQIQLNAYDSLYAFWFVDPTMTLYAESSVEKLMTPTPAAYLNGTTLNVEGNFDIRSNSIQLAILQEPSSPVPLHVWNGVTGFRKPNLLVTVDDSLDLNRITYTDEDWVSVRSLSNSGLVQSNWSYPVRLSRLPSYPLKQAIIATNTVKEDSFSISIEIDGRITPTTGNIRIVVAPDDGTAITLTDSVAPFVTQSEVFNRLIPVNTLVDDSTGLYHIGPLDTATNYVVTATYGDPYVLNGAHPMFCNSHAVATTGTALHQMLEPEQCDVVVTDTVWFRFEGNQYPTITLQIDSMDTVGNWVSLSNQTYVPTSSEWKQVDGDIYIAILLPAANTYRCSVDGGVSYTVFSYQSVNSNSSCQSFVIRHDIASKSLAYQHETVIFYAQVLGDSSGIQNMKLEINNNSQTYAPQEYQALSLGGGAFMGFAILGDTGIYQARFFDSTTNISSQSQMVVIVEDPCIGGQQPIDFATPIAHIGTCFANATGWVQHPSNDQMVGIDSLAQSWIFTGMECDSTIIAPCDLRVIQVRQGCPTRCDTSGIDLHCNEFGNYILAQSVESGWFVRISHLNTILVAEGDKIRRGQSLALAGFTGESDGTMISLYQMPNDLWDPSMQDSASYSKNFVMDATCPSVTTKLAMQDALLANVQNGYLHAVASFTNTNTQLFEGTVQLVMYRDNQVVKSANTSPTIISSTYQQIAPGGIVDMEEELSNVSLLSNHTVALRYKSWNQDHWNLVVPRQIHNGVEDIQLHNPFRIDLSSSLVLHTPKGTEKGTELTPMTHVYPNPTNGVLFIDLAHNTNILATALYDIHGRQVVRQNNSLQKIHLNELPVGVYVLRLELDNGCFSIHKVVKQ